MLQRLFVNQSGEGVCGLGNPGRQQPPNLIKKALLELRIDPSRHAFGRLLHRDGQRKGSHLVLRQRGGRIVKMMAQRATGQQIDFERTDEPLEIARLNPRGGCRIHAAQPAVQAFDTTPVGNRLEPGKSPRVSAR